MTGAPVSGGELDRREFLASVVLVAGGIAVSAAVPWPRAAFGEPAPVRLSDWTIDDVWGAYPRYAEPIDYVPYRPAGGGALAAVGSIDALLHA